MNIGIDIMGGDYAPDAIIKGVILSFEENIENNNLINYFLFGDKKIIIDKIESLSKKKLSHFHNFIIIDCNENIEMGEHPTKAFIQKQNSSIVTGFKYLAEKKIDSFASAGNTGAMLVGAMQIIKPIEGITRPCITAAMPKENGETGVLLDVGINADCKPEHLSQFAVLGNLFAKHILNIEKPKIGLLNIGEEEKKGNILAQNAHQLIKENESLNFIGNIEGRDLFNDKADVIVCDGFTGNILLKEAEEVYSIVKRRGIKDEYFERFNYENYGGTPILGINANVIIGHGISNEKTIKNMLQLSKDVIENNLSEKIAQAFKN